MTYRAERAALEARRDDMKQRVEELRRRLAEQQQQIRQARAQLVPRLSPPQPWLEGDARSPRQIAMSAEGIFVRHKPAREPEARLQASWLDIDDLRLSEAVLGLGPLTELAGHNLEVKRGGNWEAIGLGNLSPQQIAAFGVWRDWFQQHRHLLAAGREPSVAT